MGNKLIVLTIESGLSRYYVDQEITDDITQLVYMILIFRDSSGNYLSGETLEMYHLPIARRNRVIKSEYQGIVRDINQKTWRMDPLELQEEKR